MLALLLALTIDRAALPELAHLAAPAHVRGGAANLQHDGDVAALPRPIALRSGRIVVDGARAVRLRVSADAPLWIAGDEDESFERFDPGESSWTPTTHGSTVYVVTEGSGTIAAFAVIEAAQPASACLVDVACASGSAELDEASRAVALIRFVRDGASYSCSGALVSDASNSGTPFFLTARHCIATAEEAASIEAVWDDRAGACGVDAATNAPRTYGAELLVADAATDVALLRLRKLPPRRTFLRVETAPLAAGTPTYRISHAQGAAQSYASGVVREDGIGCASAPRPQFVYTSMTAGAIAPGSSGAPLLLPGLRIAGQLTGLCGASPNDPCATYNDAVDGALSASWPLLAPYLGRTRLGAIRR
ncbi:MAG TPA: serine protease [Thermoanaerobaculia bacterium]